VIFPNDVLLNVILPNGVSPYQPVHLMPNANDECEVGGEGVKSPAGFGKHVKSPIGLS